LQPPTHLTRSRPPPPPPRPIQAAGSSQETVIGEAGNGRRSLGRTLCRVTQPRAGLVAHRSCCARTVARRGSHAHAGAIRASRAARPSTPCSGTRPRRGPALLVRDRDAPSPLTRRRRQPPPWLWRARGAAEQWAQRSVGVHLRERYIYTYIYI